MRMQDDVDAADDLDLDDNMDMERDGDDEVEEVGEEEYTEEVDEEEDEEEEEDKDDEEDKDEDDGKEPRTISWGHMVNTSADSVDTMVDDRPIMLPEQGQEMREHSPWPQPPASAARPQTLEPRSQSQTPATHSLSGQEH
jgi:hypothetical protein